MPGLAEYLTSSYYGYRRSIVGVYSITSNIGPLAFHDMQLVLGKSRWPRPAGKYHLKPEILQFFLPWIAQIIRYEAQPSVPLSMCMSPVTIEGLSKCLEYFVREIYKRITLFLVFWFIYLITMFSCTCTSYSVATTVNRECIVRHNIHFRTAFRIPEFPVVLWNYLKYSKVGRSCSWWPPYCSIYPISHMR